MSLLLFISLELDKFIRIIPNMEKFPILSQLYIILEKSLFQGVSSQNNLVTYNNTGLASHHSTWLRYATYWSGEIIISPLLTRHYYSHSTMYMIIDTTITMKMKNLVLNASTCHYNKQIWVIIIISVKLKVNGLFMKLQIIITITKR